jgi:DNA-directed RNA polymerase subunit RPC12/RpoP
MPEYIEREALLKHAIALNNPHELGECVVPVSDIEAAPAADVALVVHGRWVEIGRNSHDYETSLEEKCSLCGRYVYRYDTEPQDNYCPNCGAKMDGKETDNG